MTARSAAATQLARQLGLRHGDALVVVDVQRDFLPGGSLAISDSDAVVEPLNAYIRAFDTRELPIFFTRDWHPANHCSFATEGGRWPVHCVQGTPGAELCRDLQIPHAELVLRKGYHREIDSYSAFYENDRRTQTGLAGYLRQRGLRRLFLAGLAFDFCVRYSSEDAHREGFDVVVIEDACRGIDVDGSMAATRQALAELGVRCVSCAAIS